MLLLHDKRWWSADNVRSDECNLPGCIKSGEHDHGRSESDRERTDQGFGMQSEPDGCAGKHHVSKRREDVPGVRSERWGDEPKSDGTSSRAARRTLSDDRERAGLPGNVQVQRARDTGTWEHASDRDGADLSS